MRTIGVVVLNFNGDRDTKECIESLAKSKSNTIHLVIIVVDNGSKSKSVNALDSFIKSYKLSGIVDDIKLIKNYENLGFAGGNNVGIAKALSLGCEKIVVLNNDTLVEKYAIEELIKAYDSNSQVGIAAPKIYFAKGYEYHKNLYKKEDLGNVIWYGGGIMDFGNVLGMHRGVDEVDKGQYDSVTETDFASGCCMMVDATVFEKVGMFDEKYYLYYEDADFSQRVKANGYSILFTPKSKIWHKNAGSAGGSGSSLQDYYITRNRMLFAMRFAPIKSKIFILKESIMLLLNGRPWQKKGILDFYSGKFGKGSFAQ